MRKLWRLGFQASLEEVVTVGGAVQLRARRAPGWRTAFVIGSPAIHRHVDDAGLRDRQRRRRRAARRRRRRRRPRRLRLRRAARRDPAVARAAPRSLAAGRDATFPMPDGPWPGTGPSSRRSRRPPACTRAQRRQARARASSARRWTGSAPGRALVVGDRLDADLAARPRGRARRRDRAHRRDRRASRPRAAEPAPALVAATLAELVARPTCAGCAGLRRAPPAPASSTRPPAAAAPLRVLPAVEARAARARPRRSAPTQTRALEHAPRAGASRRPTPARSPSRCRATGWSAPWPARCATPGRVLGVLPGGRGNDFARVLGHPARPRRGACASLADGVERDRSTSARSAAARSSASPALGFDSDANRIANEAPSRLGNARLRLRRAARAGRPGSPRDLRPSSVDGEARTLRRLVRRRRELQGLRRRDVRSRRTPSSTTALLDVVLAARRRSCASCAVLPRVFKGTHVELAEVDVLRGARGPDRRRPAVHRLRRRRPHRRSCRSRSAPCPQALHVAGAARERAARPKVAAARAAGAAVAPDRARRARPCPARCCCAWSPTPSARSAARLARGSAVISATNGKTTTAAMAAAILERGGARLVHNRAGANMAGGVASTLLGPPRRRSDGDTGLFEVDEFWLDQVVAELHPRALLLGQPLPRPARPLRRARDDRRPLGARSPPTTAARLVLNADDPLGRRPRPRPRRAVLRRRGRRHGDGRPCSTPPTPSTAAAAARPTSTTRSTSATSAATTATPAAHGRPEPAVAARRRRARRRRAARASRCARRPASAAVALPLPGLYNVYNALGAAALALALGAPLDDVVAGLEAVAPAFGRAETVRARRPRRCRSCSSRTRPAPTRCCARSCSSPASTTCSASSTTASPTAATSPGSGTPTSRSSRGRVRRVTCSGTRAAELALRLKYAGVDDGPHRRRAGPRAGARRGRRRDGRRPRCSRCRPTRRCSSCATSSSPRGAARGSFASMSAPTRCSGTTSSAAPTPRTCRCGASWPTTRPAARSLDVGAGTGRVALDLAATGTTSSRSTSTPACSAALRERAAPRARRRDGRRPTPAASTSARRFAPDPRADADGPAARRPEGRRGFLAARARPPAPRRRPGARDRRRARRLRRRARPSRPLPDMREVDGSLYASRPVALRDEGVGVSIERLRETVDARRASARSTTDVVRLDHVDAADARGRGAHGRPARRSRGARCPRPTSTSAPRWWSSVAERTLRVCALYPELMNIYADRGNLLLLERRCAWRGLGFEVDGGDARRRRRPRRARPLLPRRRSGPRPGAVRARPRRPPSARRCTPRPTRGARRPRRLRRLPAPRPLLRARATRSCPGVGPRRPAHRARGRPAPDRQRRHRGAAPRARRPARPRRLREPRRAHAPRAGEQPLGRVLQRPRQHRRRRASRACAAATSSARTSTARCCPRTRGSPTGSSRDRPRPGRPLAPLDDAPGGRGARGARQAAGLGAVKFPASARLLRGSLPLISQNTAHDEGPSTYPKAATLEFRHVHQALPRRRREPAIHDLSLRGPRRARSASSSARRAAARRRPCGWSTA